VHLLGLWLLLQGGGGLWLLPWGGGLWLLPWGGVQRLLSWNGGSLLWPWDVGLVEVCCKDGQDYYKTREYKQGIQTHFCRGSLIFMYSGNTAAAAACQKG